MVLSSKRVDSSKFEKRIFREDLGEWENMIINKEGLIFYTYRNFTKNVLREEILFKRKPLKIKENAN